MNQEQPIGSDQQGLVSARRRSAARWELKSRVALTHPSHGSYSTECGSRSSRPTTPTTIRVSLFKPEDTLRDYLVRVRIRRSRLERHPATRWPRNILPSWSHVVAACQSDPSLAEAVYPSIGPLGRRRRWRRRSTARCLLVGTTHGRHCNKKVCWR